ncbi:MAG: hypothetical protein ACI9J3_002729 [Parvicellaceae bacterium]|jgi:hypothetical protein
MKNLTVLFILCCALSVSYGQKKTVVDVSKKVGLGGARNVEVLSRKLAGRWDSESDKYLAIYTWVIHRIKYDVKNMDFGDIKSQSSKKTLRKRKGVCMHYAQLLEDLCLAADLTCEKIDGNVDRDLWVYEYPNSYHIADHSWNGLKIDDEWQLVDATFDAGYVEQKRRRGRALLKTLFNIPYVRNKLKFVRAPTFERYNMAPEEMIIDHLPESPMWQLLKDTVPVDSFRLTINEKRAYIRTRTAAGLYNFNDSIEHYQSSEFQARVNGWSTVNYNDTNYFAYAYGQEDYVYLNLVKYGDTEIEQVEDLEERYLEYDTLNHYIDLAKAGYTHQKNIEKSVHGQFRNSQIARYKLVRKENTDVIRRTSRNIANSSKMYKSLHRENKSLKEKQQKLDIAIYKLSESQLKTKSPADEYSQKVVNTSMAIVAGNEEAINKLIEANDSVRAQLNVLATVLPQLSRSISDTITAQTGETVEAELWLIKFLAIYDSVYMATRLKSKYIDTVHLHMRDSMFTMLKKTRKQLINQHHKNVMRMKKLWKSSQSSYAEMSKHADVSDLTEGIENLKVEVLKEYIEQEGVLNRLKLQNSMLKKWLKRDRSNQKSLKGATLWEKKTEGHRHYKNQIKERDRYFYRLKEIRTHKEYLSENKVHIRAKLHEIKDELKVREEKLENTEAKIMAKSK